MRYLTEIEITTLLNLGKTLELFLGPSHDDNDVINWIDIGKGTKGIIELNTYSVFDEGDIDHLDLYSFSSVNPDEEFETTEFETLESALTFIKDKYQLADLRFVNQGMIQDEYKILKEKRVV